MTAASTGEKKNIGGFLPLCGEKIYFCTNIHTRKKCTRCMEKCQRFHEHRYLSGKFSNQCDITCQKNLQINNQARVLESCCHFFAIFCPRLGMYEHFVCGFAIAKNRRISLNPYTEGTQHDLLGRRELVESKYIKLYSIIHEGRASFM